MLTVQIEKVVKDRKQTNTQKKYMESQKRFNRLIKSGVAKKRENQLLADNTNVKYNFE